jgi:hypothetical protein
MVNLKKKLMQLIALLAILVLSVLARRLFNGGRAPLCLSILPSSVAAAEIDPLTTALCVINFTCFILAIAAVFAIITAGRP